MAKSSTKIILLSIVSIMVLMGACKKEEVDYRAIQIEQIEEFMKLRGYDISPTASDLYYEETIAGVGDLPQALDTVDVYYTGYFLTGIQFDSNVGDDDPYRVVIENEVPQVITGFEEALTYMKVGGESIAILPSWIAYGANGSGYIPGYTPLVFEFEVVSISRGPGTD